MDWTILEFMSTNNRSSCGYCKDVRGQDAPNSSEKVGEEAEGEESSGEEQPEGRIQSSVTGGVWAHRMLVDDYAGLLDKGWRRSGKYLYKPNNKVTCCPQYTIRLDVTRFKMSRSQKRAMRQMNEFLANDKRPVCGIKEEDPVEKKEQQAGASSSSTKTSNKSLASPDAKRAKPADRPVLKKKEIRRAKFEEKCRKRNVDPEAIRAERRQKDADRQRTVRSYIDEARPDWKHKLEVKLVTVGSPEYEQRLDESYELYKKYQQTIHKDKEPRLPGWRTFLCDSPLLKDTHGGVNFGAFHMWYLLDDKLIAVGVVDVLPRCLSAKYMYYDPDYSFLSLGTYTALREIEQTQQLHTKWPPLKYYYMGFYIHSCPKMRYKAKFRPSELLCDKSFEWADYEICRELLDKAEDNGYVEFCPNSDRPTPPRLENLYVMAPGGIQTFASALQEVPSAVDNQELRRNFEYVADLVGPDVPNLVFYFSALNPDD
ncbi:hypothetical protein GCK72_000548 [Caenorhabditis remanei]|uniref:Arginyl-tRNA--protein transferase 1 n=1 Tax=Caenorhabditis remanei TaxID=31234 RepID=A0A6A5HMD8_CAERE|nr:hypothetical protein GCK72_000548 [Caenorhabditis remanei]KAF1768735.1 hypothetical protein GCK72_000548 [Caenorhabditis remanei]